MLVSGRVDTNKKGVLKKEISPASLIWLVIYRVSTSPQEPTWTIRDVKHRLQLAVIYQIFLPLGAGSFSPQLSSQQHQCLGKTSFVTKGKLLLRDEVDVSENSGTPKIIVFNRVFHYKPSILRYHYFWKHPCWTQRRTIRYEKLELEVTVYPSVTKNQWVSVSLNFFNNPQRRRVSKILVSEFKWIDLDLSREETSPIVSGDVKVHCYAWIVASPQHIPIRCADRNLGDSSKSLPIMVRALRYSTAPNHSLCSFMALVTVLDDIQVKEAILQIGSSIEP